MKRSPKLANFGLLCLILSGLLADSLYCPGNLPLNQYIALYQLYNHSSGPNWCNEGTLWKPLYPYPNQSSTFINAPCTDQWEGITCSCVDVSDVASYSIMQLQLSSFCMLGTITSDINYLSKLEYLSLASNFLFDSIPSTLFSLSGLIYLDLSDNMLTNTISSDISQLENIYSISLEYNSLNGSIPISIVNLTKLSNLAIGNNRINGDIPNDISKLILLQNLSLPSNSLSGTLPSGLGMLSSLLTLDVSSNLIEGTIPVDVGWNLINLRYLYLYSNLLKGSIPSSIGNMSDLYHLDLFDNSLTGSIPTSLGQLEKLIHFYLYENRLNGTFPVEVYNLRSMVILSINSNSISGSIPSQVSKLQSMKSFNVGTNLMTGTVPCELGLLTQLQYLELTENSFRGSICDSIYNLTNLSTLDLSSNSLTGTLSPMIGQLSHVEMMYLYANQFRGSLPMEIGQLASVLHLDIFLNSFDGSIPYTIGNLTNMTYFYGYGNYFVGKLPLTISSLKNLIDFDVATNSLTGTIPSIISSMTSLETLYLLRNSFTGTIPSALCSLTNLESLALYSNRLNGSIPNDLGNLVNLQVLRLDTNSLTNTIPSSLGKLSLLNTLYLSVNSLNGSIPNELYEATSMNSFFINNNSLTGPLSSNISHWMLLTRFSLAYNYLTGVIPSQELSGIPGIVVAYVEYNYFTGPFPQQMLSNNSQLVIFDVGHNMLTGTIPNSFKTNLQYLYAYTNYLTNTLPSEVFQLPDLIAVWCYGNYMTGTLPPSIGQLATMTQLIIHDNKFTGLFFNLFNESYQLEVIDISNNLFSGTLTESFFHLPVLSAISGVLNCFVGTLPRSICSAGQTLSVLVFDGAGSNQECISNAQINTALPTKIVDGTFSTLGIEGTIPTCLMQLSRLQTLHLSGNNMRGRIPPLGNTSYLTDLTLSNNLLTGTIPMSIQTHSFQKLDLSNNRLQGTLSDAFVISAIQTTLGLAVNRLSGPLPASLKGLSSSTVIPTSTSDSSSSMITYSSWKGIFGYSSTSTQSSTSSNNFTDLNILASNIFGCSLNDIPSLDRYSRSYSCGSYELEIASYIWTGIAGVTLLCAVIVIISWRNPQFFITVRSKWLKSTIEAIILLGDKTLFWWLIANGLLVYHPSDRSRQSTISSEKSLNKSKYDEIQFKSRSSYWKLWLIKDKTNEAPRPSQSGRLSLTPMSVPANGPLRPSSAVSRSSLIKVNDQYTPTPVDVSQIAIDRSFHPSASLVSLSPINNGQNPSSISFSSLSPMTNVSMDSSSSNSRASRDLTSSINALSLAVSVTSDQRYLGLVETRAFLIIMNGIKYFTIVVGIILIVLIIPVYVGLESIASIVSYQYAYIVSITFLHGIAPVLFIGLILIGLLIFLMITITILRNYFTQSLGEVLSPSNDNPHWKFRLMKYSLLFLFHLINIIVTVAVNTAYVNAILTDDNITRLRLLFIQSSVGIFKIIWNTTYTPWCTGYLSSYMSHPRTMHNRYVMSLTNFIIAPCIATLSVNQSCFYFIFRSSKEVSSSIFINLCDLAIPCEDQTKQTIIFSSSFNPSFQYSYACGTALLVSYLPVLLYTYVINSFGVPIGRYCVAIYSSSQSKSWNLLRSLLLYDKETNSSERLKGRDLIITMMIHLTILLTFGFASPVLGVCVLIAIFGDYITVKIVLGRFLAIASTQSSIESSNAINHDEQSTDRMQSLEIESTEPSKRLIVVTRSSTKNPMLINKDSAPSSRTVSNISHLSSQATTIDITLLERSDMRDSWRGLFACMNTMIFTITIFWGLLFFDMISDYYDVISGLIVMTVFGLALPLMVIGLALTLSLRLSIIELYEGMLVWLLNLSIIQSFSALDLTQDSTMRSSRSTVPITTNSSPRHNESFKDSVSIPNASL